MLFFSLATAGAVLVSVIAAAISVTRRRTGLRNVKVPPQSRLTTIYCTITPHRQKPCCPGHSGTSRTDGKIPRGSGFLLVRPVVWQRVSRGRTRHCFLVPCLQCRGCWVLTGALLASEKLCRIRLVPFSAVLGVIVGLLVVFTSLPWFLGNRPAVSC